MNGKQAKRLRQLAEKYVVGIMKKKMSDGHGLYHTAMNRIEWVAQLDSDGFPMKDPEGTPLIKPGPAPGTITNAWTWRVLYRRLKRQWQKRVR